MLKALDPFYPCLLVLRAIGFLLLPFGLKSFWLFLLAFFLFFCIFFLQALCSLLFLASRINFMIFQIINNIFLFSLFFQEPTILTFMNNNINNMHCSSIHSENKKYCHHIKIIKLVSRMNSKFMYLFFCN